MPKIIAPESENILVVGNGFDLDLGLPTGYSHFIASPLFDGLVNSGSKTAIYLKKRLHLQKWVDIETELAELSKHNVVESEQFRKEYIELRKTLTAYINQLDYNVINKTSGAARLIQDLVSKGGELVIVDFNYTESVSVLLADAGSTATHIHIHGRAKEENIVFGVQDRARISDNHVFLKKAVSHGFYDEFLAADLMKAATKSVNIFGHSLGITDHTQFYPFFGAGENSKSYKINIYYHAEAAFYDLYEQLDRLTDKRLQRFKIQHDFKMIGPVVS